MHSEEPFADQDERPQLNFDILRLVCIYLIDVSDVLSFALTCSSLTEDSFRRRLRMSPVDLSNGNSLDRFHTFIFSNQPSRAPSIYGLKLPCPHDDPRVMIKDGCFDRLAEILEAAVHIQYLNFATSIINPVFDVVAKAATLRELWVFTDVYEQPLRTRLATFRSPLRTLLVDGSEFVGDTISASYLHDHLSHLAPTLEFLDLDEFPIRIPPSSVTTQFTAVRTLKVKTAFNSDSNPLDVLLRLFPRLDNTLDLGQLIGNIREEDYLAFRERSKDAQKRRARRLTSWLSSAPSVAWIWKCSIFLLTPACI